MICYSLLKEVGGPMDISSLVISMIVFNVSAYLLIKLRSKLYHNKVFKPMITNIKLSVIPMFVILAGSGISIMILYTSIYFNNPMIRLVSIVFFVLTLLVWILLLPNSGYLVTELNLTHRSMDEHEVPIWYDIVSVFVLSFSGILNMLMGIFIIQLIYLIYFDPAVITFYMKQLLILMALAICFLVSVGIYLGREVRFNSWDVLHPFKFIVKIFKHLRKPGEFKNSLLFILLHTIFFMLMYYTIAPKW